MHYMHYKDYIHHGLVAEKTPLPCHRGGEPSGWVGGVWGSLLIYIYIYIYIYACVCVYDIWYDMSCMMYDDVLCMVYDMWYMMYDNIGVYI